MSGSVLLPEPIKKQAVEPVTLPNLTLGQHGVELT
jgi:hypothetical protein